MATEEECTRRNCCWSLVDKDRTIACYFPADYPTYEVIGGVKEEPCGISVIAKRSIGAYSVPPELINEIKLSVLYETDTRVRIRITDLNAQRWEPPVGLAPPALVCPKDKKYRIGIDMTRLGFNVTRRLPGQEDVVLIDSTGLMASAFVFANQFLQIAFKVNAIHGYGLGEREDNFPIEMHEWKRMAFWARDDIPQKDANLYGVHNIFLGFAPGGTAFGFFFLNSNAFEVTKQPLPSLAFRAIGGILEFFVFVGPSPNEVVSQYYALIGHPPVPPYWAFGYQLSRYGYSGVEEIRSTVERNRKARIPQDVQWLDIDYMDRARDWTLSLKDEFKGLSDFVVNELRRKFGLRIVVIVDVGIPITEEVEDYFPYKAGMHAGVFINDSQTGKPLIGSVWPGETVFPDFTKNETEEWWYQCARNFYQKFEYDGLWIDMNEPSNFYDGSNNGCDNSDRLNVPPYHPHVVGSTLFSKTICPSALHVGKIPHYNLHNMYALHQAKMTYGALQRIFPGKRPFLLTRSSFSGSGRYAAHWSGDVRSTWRAMAETIPQMINFNIYGIPMFGADICGFVDETTEELCVRWSQLGAFYPFSRNHNAIGVRDQDPASWSKDSQKAIAAVLGIRYQLLPYMYTLFHDAQHFGRMVIKALAFDYPTDLSTHHISRQFLVGSCLNVAPVLSEGMRYTLVYLPEGEWIELTNLKRYISNGKYYSISARLDKIPVFYRAGCIIPMHPPGAMTTQEAREMGLGITAILSNTTNGTAQGKLVWDDGETENGEVLVVKFFATHQRLKSMPMSVTGKRGKLLENVTLQFIHLIGVSERPTSVKLNDKQTCFDYNAYKQHLNVSQFQSPISLKDVWELTWN